MEGKRKNRQQEKKLVMLIKKQCNRKLEDIADGEWSRKGMRMGENFLHYSARLLNQFEKKFFRKMKLNCFASISSPGRLLTGTYTSSIMYHNEWSPNWTEEMAWWLPWCVGTISSFQSQHHISLVVYVLFNFLFSSHFSFSLLFFLS